MTTLFKLGAVVSTPAALKACAELYTLPDDLLERHKAGDWGDLCDDDKETNQSALTTGARLFSSYKLDDKTVIWVITEAEDDSDQRCCTTLLLPSEY